MQYQIKRSNSIVATIKAEWQHTEKIMGENTLTLDFELPYCLDVRIDDAVEFEGHEYTLLMALPPIKKSSSIHFSHTCVFKGPAYQLDKVAYLNYDADNILTIGDFSLMGNAETFIDLLIANANRDQTGWQKGVIDVTDFKNLPFSGVKCLEVLGTIASTFNTEWWVDGKTIHMTKKGVLENLSFEYGKNKGLEEISRNENSELKLLTRLYAYGSERNISASYKGYSNRLKLPGNLPYLQENVYVDNDPLKGKLYGVIEDTVFFNDIYPHRLGVVTAVADKLTFSDSQIDFDVNDYLLEGTTAKVIFQTGLLGGYQFEISRYDNATKTFKIIINKNEKDFEVPSDTLKPAIGDQYILVDINMPAAYITAAENDLLAKAQEYLDKRKHPPVSYSVTCDPLYMKRNNVQITLGNYVHFTDVDFGLNANIRVIGKTRSSDNPFMPQLELAQDTTIAAYLQQAVQSELQAAEFKLIGKSANRAYDSALQAKATADAVSKITSYWGVTIDEAAGLIAAGTLNVGDGPYNNAGITGVTDNGDQSTRFWAGAPYGSKDSAIFRVLNDGQVFARRLKLGYGSTQGIETGWDVTPQGILSDPKDSAVENFALIRGSSFGKEFSFGTEIVPLSAGGQYSQIGRIVNKRVYANPVFPTTNTGLSIEVYGANYNTALHLIQGDLRVDTGNIIVADQTAPEDYVIQYKGADGSNRKFTLKKGIFIKDENL